MYSQTDLDEAVAAGAVSAEAAKALRSFVDLQRATPAVDEEQFRLITGFNDIFVSIASAILLFAVGWIGQSIGQSAGLVFDHDGPSPFAPAAVAATAWGLALFFTAKRRMALPSIMLLLAFVGGVFATSMLSVGVVLGIAPFEDNERVMGIAVAASAAIAAGAAYLHWSRFRVPITIAAGAAAVAGIAIGLLRGTLGDIANFQQILLGFVLLLGIGVFLFAMRWDSSDPARVTRRSRRRLLAPFACGADDRPPDLHFAWIERRHRQHWRRLGRRLRSTSCSASRPWQSTVAHSWFRRWPMFFMR